MPPEQSNSGVPEWRFYVHDDGRYVSINDGRSGDTLLKITDHPEEAYADIAKVRAFAEHFATLPHIHAQRDQEWQEKLERVERERDRVVEMSLAQGRVAVDATEHLRDRAEKAEAALAQRDREIRERLLSEAARALGDDLQLFRAFESIVDAALSPPQQDPEVPEGLAHCSVCGEKVQAPGKHYCRTTAQIAEAVTTQDSQAVRCEGTRLLTRECGGIAVSCPGCCDCQSTPEPPGKERACAIKTSRHEIEPGVWIVSPEADPDPDLLERLKGASFNVIDSLKSEMRGEDGRVEKLEQRVENLRTALEPFARFADGHEGAAAAEAHPDWPGDGQWSDFGVGLSKDRIVDWFGPTDFYHASAAYNLTQSEPPGNSGGEEEADRG